MTPTVYLSLSCRADEESANYQKLGADKAAAESKIKALEEQVTLVEDNIGKVQYCIFSLVLLWLCAVYNTGVGVQYGNTIVVYSI